MRGRRRPRPSRALRRGRKGWSRTGLRVESGAARGSCGTGADLPTRAGSGVAPGKETASFKERGPAVKAAEASVLVLG